MPVIERCVRCGARLYPGSWGSRIGRVCISCSYALRDEDRARYEREELLRAARRINDRLR